MHLGLKEANTTQGKPSSPTTSSSTRATFVAKVNREAMETDGMAEGFSFGLSTAFPPPLSWGSAVAATCAAPAVPPGTPAVPIRKTIFITPIRKLAIHSFIPDISIAPLQVHTYSEALSTAA